MKEGMRICKWPRRLVGAAGWTAWCILSEATGYNFAKCVFAKSASGESWQITSMTA